MEEYEYYRTKTIIRSSTNFLTLTKTYQNGPHQFLPDGSLKKVSEVSIIAKRPTKYTF